MLGVRAGCTAILFLLVAATCAADGRPPVSGYAPAVLDHLAKIRYVNAGTDHRFVLPEATTTAVVWRQLLERKDFAAAAQRLVAAYETPEAASEFAGLTCALQEGAVKGKMLSDRSDAAVAVVDALGAGPGKDLVVAETLLQIASGGLSNLSLNGTIGGGPLRLVVPDAIAAKAATLLTHADPFVRGMAEWTLAIAVVNTSHGETSKKKDAVVGWKKSYLAVPAAEYAGNDQVRQAVSLAAHRRAADLAALSADIARRAEAKANWLQQAGRAPPGLAAARSALATALAACTGDAAAQRRAYLAVRQAARAVVLTDPALAQGLIYATRPAPSNIRQPGSSEGRNYPAGGTILVQQGLSPDAPVRDVLGDQLRGGGLQAMDLWYDADRLVFSWAKGSIANLHEIRLDGTGLRTLAESQYTDANPAYLADGSVVFASFRCLSQATCASNQGLIPLGGVGQTNIYRVAADGQTVRRLSVSKDNDDFPHALDDGRVVWMRWDYQERSVNEIFSLWSINPDGTASDGYYRVHIPHEPTSKGVYGLHLQTVQVLRSARQISGTPYLIAAGGSHYMGTRGAVVLVDPTMGINNPDGIRNVTPNISPLVWGWGKLAPVAEGGVSVIGGNFSHPWGLSDKTFLATFEYDQPSAANGGGYYLDVWGNLELLHRDPVLETTFLMPLTKRVKPPVLPDTTKPELDHATLYLDNVYADLPGVEKGQVKAIRLLQMMRWYAEVGQQGLQWHPIQNTSWAFGYGTCAPVRVIGTVPVEADGSAHFQVPAETDVYMQAIDANGMALQRMRTHVEFARGEFRSCIGCHETRSNASAAQAYGRGLALAKPAVRPSPPPWGDTRPMDFERLIQPILEAKCVSCHGGAKTDAGLDLSAAKDQYGFMQSFRSMFGLKKSDPTPGVLWGADPNLAASKNPSPKHPWWEAMTKLVTPRGPTQGEVTKVKQFGAWQMPLILALIKDPKHRQMLTDAEMQTLACWADVAAPYFDTYVRDTQSGKGKNKKLERVLVTLPPPFAPNQQHLVEKTR